MIKQTLMDLKKITFYNIILYVTLAIAVAIGTIVVISIRGDLFHAIIFLGVCSVTCFLSLIWVIDRERFVGFFIFCIPIIPLYQRFLLYRERGNINIEVIFLEVLFLFALLGLFLIKKNRNIFMHYKNDFKVFNSIMFIWIVLNLVSILFSIDAYRSFLMFLIGILSPALVFYLIANKTKVNYRMLNFLVLSLISSGTVFILLGLFLNIRQTVEIGKFMRLETGNIYGSNALVGSISFMLPLIFMSGNYYRSFWKGNIFRFFRFVLFAFTVLSTICIIISLSRWGYATFLVAILLVILFDRRYPKFYRSVLLATSLLFVFFFFGQITEMIIQRFVQGNPFNLYYLSQTFITNARWDIWQNAWESFKDYIMFGVGLGNHFLVSPQGYTTAHNMFLNILVERGIFVWIILLGIIVYFYKVVFKFRKNSKNYKLRRLSLFLALGMTTFLFWTLAGGDLVQATGFISAIRAHYFSFILGLQLYIMKLDSLNPESIIQENNHE